MIYFNYTKRNTFRGGEIILKDCVKSGALTEVSFFILISLKTPKHGYAIMQFIEAKTNGRVILGAGTLYGALNSLLAKGWITPYNNPNNHNTRRKEYIITEKGINIIRREFERLNSLVEIAYNFLFEGNDDNEKNN